MSYDQMPMLIDGELCPSASERWFEHIDPYREVAIGTVADADEADVGRAVAAARRAFDETDWSLDASLRAHCLTQLRDAVLARRDEFVEVLIAEIGCVRTLAEGAQFVGAIDWLTTSIDYTESYQYERDAREIDAVVNFAPGAPKPARRMILSRPWGVVGALSAYNYPLTMCLGKIGPALGAGNTMVLKSAAQAPVTSALLAKVAEEETELPAGVLNIVIGRAPELGRALVEDPRVDMINFTGSAEIGRVVARTTAARFAKAVIELGGKSATIVLDDADAEEAAHASVLRVCANGGQGCTNLTRLLVPASEYRRVTEVAARTCDEVVWGDPSLPETHLGPLITRQHQSRVLGFVRRAVNDGATLIGGSVEPPDVEHGYFVLPTVLGDVDPGSEVAQEEIFGPVLTILPYEGGDDAAVALANTRATDWAGPSSAATTSARSLWPAASTPASSTSTEPAVAAPTSRSVAARAADSVARAA